MAATKLRAILTVTTGAPRFFDYRGTPILARLAVAGLILLSGYLAGDLGNDRLDGIYPATFLFVCGCFLVLGLAFGATAWLPRTATEKSAADASRRR